MAEQKIILTEEGLKKLEERHEYLVSVKRREVAERLKEAIALGDLSENSEYDDAKNEQSAVETEILDLMAKIRNAEIIKKDDSKKNVVHMGDTVVIKDMEFGDEMEYTLVGSTEADPTEMKISNESPVGAAILGQKVGKTVEVTAPAGVLKYKIVKIKQ
ncbi:MAG: transcription elongation factor GreA [Selenomonadaceae bacterium]|nr:transcription elongation factor GreA [Selenomonadaceae bacterium]